MSEEFSCQIGKLPSEVLDEVTATVATFSSPIIYHDQLIGSGTFAEINGRHGILTATHVVGLIDLSPNSEENIRLCIAEFAHDFQIPLRHLDHHSLADLQCEEFGPDLSFVELLGRPDVGAIAARKSFYSITNHLEEKLRESEVDRGIWVIAGNPDELAYHDEPTGDFSQVIALPGIGACTGVEARHKKFGFDYVDIGADYTGKSNPPKSFGGCSGAGLWRVELVIDARDSDRKIRCDRFYLSGVAFFQTGIERNHRQVRSHGPHSIYRHLVKKISETVRPEPEG